MGKVLTALLCAALSVTAVSAHAQTSSTVGTKRAATAETEPPAKALTAEALYDEMVAAWHKADSIYYESDYQIIGPDTNVRCNYKIWLKKPNYVLLEAYQEGKLKGVILGDGENFHIYWPGNPPRGYAFEKREGEKADSAAEATMAYVSHPAPAGRHSIAGDAGFFGIGLSLVTDPSMFSGAPDPMQSYIDSGRLEGTETVAGEKCDVLHLYCTKAHSETTLWLSQADHLPRKGKQVAQEGGQYTLTEAWSKFQLNGEIADSKFAFAPQKNLRKIRKAELEDGVLAPGTVAPEFSLMGADGKPVSLSSYRGNVVWLHIWTAG